MKRIFVGVAILLLAAFVMVGCVPANFSGSKLVTGGNYTLNAGETINGNLVIAGGNAILKEGARVNGDVTVLGGNADLFGTITGNLALMGGNVTLGSSAVVKGDVTVRGGNVTRANGAQVDGRYASGESIDIPYMPVVTGTPRSPLDQGLGILYQALLSAILAGLAMLFLPQQITRAAAAVVDHPSYVGGTGLLALIATPLLIVLLAITIILIPLALGLALLFGLAIAFGWAVLGLETGRRIARVFHWDTHPALVAAMGTLALSFGANLLGTIPFIGWIVPFAVTCLALGSIVLTRLGTQDYIRVPRIVAPQIPQGTIPGAQL